MVTAPKRSKPPAGASAIEKRDYRFSAIPAHRTLAAIVGANRSQFGSYEALCYQGDRFTNTALFERAGRLAGVLCAAGVGRGDRVVVNLVNCPEIWLAYLACVSLDAVIVPTVPSLLAEELNFVVTDCEASAVFTTPGKAAFFDTNRKRFSGLKAVFEPDEHALDAMLEAAAPFQAQAQATPDELAAVIYTSGTTGKPKGVKLSQSNLCRQVCLNYGFYAGPDDDARAAALLMPLPMCHVFGLAVALTSLLMGNLMVMMERFDPAAALDLIRRHAIRIVPAVPTMLIRIVGEPGAAASCRSVAQWDCGGSAMPVDLIERIERELGGVCTEGWGLSEASSAAVQNVPTVPQKRGSVGLVLPGLELAVRTLEGARCGPHEQGELLLRGETVMQGYWNRPEATAAALDGDGFLHTGDIGYVDEDGYCFIVGRKDDLIIRGGRNISPREIEEIIQQHPAVEEVAVIGLPHPELGQTPAAFVVAAPGVKLDGAEITALCREHLAPYKTPTCVEVVAALPHNPTGKVLKEELRRQYAS
jgi:long-chain acyl-CoA synthetase